MGEGLFSASASASADEAAKAADAQHAPNLWQAAADCDWKVQIKRKKSGRGKQEP